jgi:transcriptional regulator with XRE-family HTH domain
LGVAGIQKWTAREVRALREALRMSSRDFAGRLGLSDRAVSKWESPTKPTVPRADSQAMLDTMLAKASDDERARFERFLADDPAEAAEIIKPPPVEQIEISSSQTVANGYAPSGLAYADTLDVDDVERREILKIMGGMALAAPLSGHVNADALRRELDSTLNAPTTSSDVEEWERVAAQYSAESGVIPPARLLPELLTDLDEALLRLKGSPESLRGPMSRFCGQLSALAAANFYNGGDERNARRYWRTALRIINQAKDRPAQARLYAFRASFALSENPSSPSTALTFADDAIGIAEGIPCAGAASGYATRANALALLGDHRESERTLHELTETFSRIPEAVTSSRLDGVSFSEQNMRFTEGWIYAYAGRVPDATKALDAGRSLVPDGHWIAIASWEASRAICLIRGGDPSEGARHVARTLQGIPSGFRQASIVRYSAVRALSAVPVGAANMPTVIEARELLSL